MSTQNRSMPGFIEFIALTAMVTSLAALAIDAMLPALPNIAQDLGLQDVNHAQLIIPVLFLGLGVGQIIVGPLSDSIGRKLPIYIGLFIFLIGTVMCMVADDFTMMLWGRFLQGVGTAAPRIVVTALIRDCYSGRAMAQIMSFSMIVFIMVPVLAPMLGQGILLWGDWRWIFASFLILTLIVLVWFAARLPETLAPEKRIPLQWSEQWRAAKSVFRNKTTMGYTLTTGLVFSGFLGYLSSSQQILQVEYNLGVQFPFYFASLALTLGVASLINGKLVMKYGMKRLSRLALILVVGVSTVFLLIAWNAGGLPVLWLFIIYCMILFSGIGVLFGNLNALAMEPLGENAGMGSSIIGSISTLIAVPIGTLIGQMFDGTVLPLVLGFLILGSMSLMAMHWTERSVS